MTPKRVIIPVFVPHAGCPNDCVFCNQRRISGALRPADEKDVVAAIESAKGKFQPGTAAELAFYGGSFTAIPAEEQERLLRAALPFVRSGEISSIRLSTRPDCIDEEIIDRLLSFGVTTVELGAQSMSPEVLAASNRGHTAEDTRRAVRLLKEKGFSLILQMMTGLPEDTPERSLYTASELIKLEPDGVRIYPTVIVRDTELYNMWKRGEYREHTVRDAVELCAEIVPMFLSNGIPVIRLGLNPTDDLSGGDAAAGAYHPAFGELVYSEIYRRRAAELLMNTKRGTDAVLGVARGKTSLMVGQKRCNIVSLKEQFGLRSLKVRETDVPDGDIKILSIEKD